MYVHSLPPAQTLHRPGAPRTVQSGFPYVAVFLRKEPEWNQAAGGSDDAAAAGEAGGGPVVENKDGVIEGSAENAVQQTFPEVITSLDEIHEVGTLAQVSVGEGLLRALEGRFSRAAVDGEKLRTFAPPRMCMWLRACLSGKRAEQRMCTVVLFCVCLRRVDLVRGVSSSWIGLPRAFPQP